MKTVLAAFLLPLSFLGLIVVGGALFFVTLPDVRTLKGCLTTSMYNVRLCPGDRSYTPLKGIAPELVDAIVVSEDASFFSHHGFDWHELKESLSTNLQSAGFKRGGSTLTQQLAKNVFLSKEKSLFRKIREAALTVQLERNFSKQELIERYLNVVEFGPQIFGVKAAAAHYFGKDPSQLHVLEAAFLAFLLPNPKGYSKSFSQKSLTPFAQKMIRQIVHRLANFKKISPQTMQLALNQIQMFPWAGLSREELNTETQNLRDDFASPPIEENPESDDIHASPEESLDAEESSTWD